MTVIPRLRTSHKRKTEGESPANGNTGAFPQRPLGLLSAIASRVERPASLSERITWSRFLIHQGTPDDPGHQPAGKMGLVASFSPSDYSETALCPRDKAALLTTAVSSLGLNGLAMKSNAPLTSASLATSTVAYPVMSMTLVCLHLLHDVLEHVNAVHSVHAEVGDNDVEFLFV